MGTAWRFLRPLSKSPAATAALVVLLVLGDSIPLLAGAEFLSDRFGAMRGCHVDFKSKRHLVVANWAIHDSCFGGDHDAFARDSQVMNSPPRKTKAPPS